MSGAERIQTLLELPVRAGEEQVVAELFRELGIFELAGRNEGFLGARLLLPDEPGEPLIVVADWSDADAVRRWVDDPARARTTRSLEPHLAGEPTRRGYSIGVEWPPSALEEVT